MTRFTRDMILAGLIGGLLGSITWQGWVIQRKQAELDRLQAQQLRLHDEFRRNARQVQEKLESIAVPPTRVPPSRND